MAVAADSETLIYHITDRHRWEGSAGDYTDPSLDTDGFIHCSTAEQLLMPANALFAGRTGLVVLAIVAERLGSEVVFEDCYDSGHAFPHVYGPIERAAVIDVHDFEPGPDGTFELPEALQR